MNHREKENSEIAQRKSLPLPINLPTTVIIRHRRENLKKCSLTGLETHPALRFFTYPVDSLPDLSNCLLLKVSAPPLTKADSNRNLLLIDGTWRLAQVIEKNLRWKFERAARRNPGPSGPGRASYPSGCGKVLAAPYRSGESPSLEEGVLQTRSLPGSFQTAYPRKQTHCPDPHAGLSSVEALYLAHLFLGKPTSGLLDHYYWKEQFLNGCAHAQESCCEPLL